MSIFLNDVEYGGPQPVATTSTLGISKPDGTSLDIDASGTLSVKNVAASKVNYDNTTSQIESTDTQTAIDYIVAEIAGIDSELNEKAPLASPTLTGVPKAPTASAGTNSTQIATTAFVQAALPSVGNGTITIKQAGTTKGTFTTNQSGDTTIELTDNNTTYSSKAAVSGGTDVSLVTTGEKATWNNALQVNGDSKSNTVTFTSNDTTDANATSWTSVTTLSSGITHTTFFQRVSQMFKNVRYLYKVLGTTDISSIGDGTVKGAISTLNGKITTIENTLNKALIVEDNN